MLTEGFQVISDGLAAVTDRNRSFLTVSCGLAFAARFLVPRLVKWTAEHPDIEIRLVTTSRLVDFHREEIDVAIRFGKGDWPHQRTEKIADQPVQLVYAPELGEQFSDGAELKSLSLIVDEQSLVDWYDWANATDNPPLDPSRHPRIHVPDASLAYEAAISGQGLWLAWPALTHDAVKSGSLNVHPASYWKAGLGYWTVSTPTRWRREPVRRFRAWLRETYSATQ
jgi:LysR family glycine cleavage system transcriptional activator